MIHLRRRIRPTCRYNVYTLATLVCAIYIFTYHVPNWIQLHSRRTDLGRHVRAPIIQRPREPPVLSVRPAGLEMTEIENYLPNAYLYPNKSAPYNSSVLCFLHNPKSGGTTMRDCMIELSERAGRRAPVILSMNTTSLVRTRRLNREAPVRDYYAGEATMGMCDFVDGRPCSYFTMIREPYSRAVSHYYFCKASGGKTWPSCDKSLEEFTLSLCSLFFSQLTMKLLCQRGSVGVDESGSSRKWKCEPGPTNIDYFPIAPEDRAATLDYILQNLDKIFAVVGITEEFETSLRLLERTFGRPFHGVCNGKHSNTGSYITINTNQTMDVDRKRIHDEAKKRLMANEKVRKCLREDIAIYDRVKEIFRIQKAVAAE